MKFKFTAILSTVLLLSTSSIYASDDIEELPSYVQLKASIFKFSDENPFHVHNTLVFLNDEDRPETINKPQEITAMEWLEQLENARNDAKCNNQMSNVEFLTREISATLGGKYGFRRAPATKEEIVKILTSVKRTRTYYSDKPDIISDLYFSHDPEACVRNIDENPHFAKHMGIITIVDAIRAIVMDSSIETTSFAVKPRQIIDSKIALKAFFNPKQYPSSMIKNIQKTVKGIAINIHAPANEALIGKLFDLVSIESFEQLLRSSIDGEAVYRYGNDLYDGGNVENLPDAIGLFESSLNMGYTFARHALARAKNDHAVDLLNENVKRNYDEAFKMFCESFNLGCIYAYRNAALIFERDHSETEERKNRLRKTTTKDFRFVKENEGIILYNTAFEILEEASSCAFLLGIYYQVVSVYLERADALDCQLAKSQAGVLYKFAIKNYLLDDKNEGIDTYVSNLLKGKTYSLPDVYSDIAIRLLEASIKLGYSDAEAVLDRILAFRIISTAKENSVREAASYLGKSAEKLDRTIRILEKSIELDYQDIQPILEILEQANIFRSMSSLKDGDVDSAKLRLEIAIEKVITSPKKRGEVQRMLDNLKARDTGTSDEVTVAA